MDTTLQIKGRVESRPFDKAAFSKEVVQDMLQIIACFAGAVFAVYYAPNAVNLLYFLGLMGLFWFSKKDYFWFLFFFVLMNTPGHLFFESSAGALKRLPLYKFLPGLSLSVYDLFILVSLAKVYYHRHNIGKRFSVATPAKFILFYFLLVSLPLSFIIGFEHTGTSFFNNFRPYFYYVLTLSFYFLVGSKTEDIYKMGYLTVPFLFFTIFDQLFLLTTGKLFISIINPETIRYIVTNTVTGGARAYFSGFLLLFYGFLFGLQLRMNSKYELISGTGYLIIILTFTAFVLSATRAYLMMPLMVFVGYVFYSKKAGPDLVKLSLATVLFGVIFFSLNLISWESFVQGIWPRFEAFFTVIFGSGELQKFDTVASRLESDLPELWEAVNYSPILGAGFSGWFRKYINDDLGFLNTVLVVGWVGFALFLNFFVFFLIKLNRWASKKYADKDSKVILNSIAMMFFGILLGYATTYDYFTVMQTERIYFISLLLGSAEVAAQRVKENRTNFFKHKFFKT